MQYYTNVTILSKVHCHLPKQCSVLGLCCGKYFVRCLSSANSPSKKTKDAKNTIGIARCDDEEDDDDGIDIYDVDVDDAYDVSHVSLPKSNQIKTIQSINRLVCFTFALPSR